MALITRAEFARTIKKDRAYVTVNVKRGKIIVDENGLIDIDNEINQLFIDKTNAITEPVKTNSFDNSNHFFEVNEVKKKPIEQKVKKIKVEQVEQVEEKVEQVERVENPIEVKKPKLDITEKSLTDLEREKKELDILIKREELELKKIEVEKKNGLLVPTDLIKGLISSLGKNYVHTFRREMDKMILKTLHELNADDKYKVKTKALLITTINKAIDQALEMTELQLEYIIDENKFVK